MEMIRLRPMKTAFIGCGGISSIYLDNCIKWFNILDVYACCDLNEEAAKQTAAKYNIRIMTIEEIIADPDIELVVNLTGPKTHYKTIKQLLEGGKHVYSEKVLALSLEEAKELLEISEKTERQLCVAPDTILGSAIQNAKQLIDRNMLGNITSFRVSLTRNFRRMAELLPDTALPEGDIAINVAIYHITTLIYLFGPVKSVVGMTSPNKEKFRHYLTALPRFGEVYEMNNDVVTAACVEFQNGILGTMLFNSDSVFPEQPSFTVMGRYGILTIKNPDDFGGDVMLQRDCMEPPVAIPSNFAGKDNMRGMGVAEMAWSIRLNRTPRTNKEMAYHALEVLLGIKLSAKSGIKYDMKSTCKKGDALPEGYAEDPYFPDYEAALI